MPLDGSGQGTAAAKDHVALIPPLDLGELGGLAEERDRTVDARTQFSC